MTRIHINEIKNHINEGVVIAGFAQVIRDQKNIKFVVLRDISGIVQAVVKKDAAEAMKIVESLSLESVIEINGTVKEEPQAPNGFEIVVSKISVLSSAEPELPIPIVEKGGEEVDQSIRLDWRWLDLRKPKNILLFKVWTLMEASLREYCVNNGFIEIHSPKIIGTPSESGAEVFELKYFERKAYLAQSPQFYKQMAMASGFEKVFEIGPVFRAEPSFTSRHATEFTGFDLEMSYIESYDDIMKEEEKMLQYALQKVKDKYGEEIKTIYNKEVIVPSLPFPRISMKEVKEILSSLNIPSEKENDLSPEEERKICEYVKEKQGHEFVFVTEYSTEVRPFYHMSENGITKSFDLLWGGIEITTGAQREHRYDVLIKQAKEKGMKIEPLQFYLNFFKYGCPPHGGLGAGLNRMVMKVLDIENIRDASFIYRGVKRLEP